jgi:hypothetical protein
MSFKRLLFKDASEKDDPNDEIVAKSTMLATASKSSRQEFIRKDAKGVAGRISAVIEIQRVFRGYLTRRHLYYEFTDEVVDKKQGLEYSTPLTHDSIQKCPQDALSAASSVGRISSAHAVESVSYGEVIVSSRGSARQRSPTVRARNNSRCLSHLEAAVMIQRWWRRILDMNVYKYYRDLINFRQKGDPAMMLRCINPSESKLIDAASGIHVKFRLAGDRFPPHIYYKVFTHRPIQDLGAFAPRDYTHPDYKKLVSRNIHNKTGRSTFKPTDRSGWYKRVENNGWRIVSDQLIQQYMKSVDPVTSESASKKINFHYSKLQRRAEVEKQRKQRKIQWLQKMYKQGMLEAQLDNPNLKLCIDGASRWLNRTVETDKVDTVEDWEVDELLDWSTALNFDEYWAEWRKLATSNSSAAAVLERLELRTSNIDPFGITLAPGAASDVASSAAPQHQQTKDGDFDRTAVPSPVVSSAKVRINRGHSGIRVPGMTAAVDLNG